MPKGISMDVTAIVVLILMLAAVAAGVLLGVRALRQHRGEREKLSVDEAALHKQCVEADRVVKTQQRSHQQSVRKAEKALQEAHKVPKLASVGGVNHVTGSKVTINWSAHPLTPAVTAHLDERGDITAYSTSRSTLTRMAGGALIAGRAGLITGGLAKKSKKQKVDNRELYLMVLGPDWSEVAKISPTQGEAARRLMLAINTAAANCETFAIKQAEQIAAMSLALEETRADTVCIDGARAAREALGQDPLALVKAARKDPSSVAGPTGGGLLLLGAEDDSAGSPGAQTPQDLPQGLKTGTPPTVCARRGGRTSVEAE